MDTNQIKKDLYKSKNMAQFMYYSYGKLYYSVQLEDGVYQFPIGTVEEGPTINDDDSGLSMYETETIILSSDLGKTKFENEMRGSELIRWISMAIKSGEFIKIK